MLRILMYAVLAYVAYRILKYFSPPLHSPQDRDPLHRRPPGETELIRDPQCGAYFQKNTGVQGKINGHTLYFCTEECRRNYMRQHGKS